MPWYYSPEGKPLGPVEEPELNRLASRGLVRWDTFVWRQELAAWKPYGEVFQLDAIHCGQCARKTLRTVSTRFDSDYICLDCHALFFQKIREGYPVPGLIRYGGFWIRWLAKFIDGIALAILQIPIALIFVAISFPFLRNLTGSPGASPDFSALGPYFAIRGAGFLVQLVLGAAYTTFFVGKFGATPGKLCLNLQIVRSDFSKVSYRTAFLRHLAEFVSALTLDLGYIMAAFDDQKRALHDYMCGTRVVKKDSLEYARRRWLS